MSVRVQAVEALERALGHVFEDRALLERALTHASVGQGRRRVDTNQRLEYLGDRVLGLVVAEALYKRFPEADEGELTRRFHAVVDAEACAAVAAAAGVGEALKLAPGESKLGARANVSILGDAAEAIVAAIYLDGGLDAAREVILRLWGPHLEAGRTVSTANSKSTLQEWAAREGRPPPVYVVVAREGPDHAPVFTVEARVEGVQPERGEGRSRQDAEKAAAAAMLKREGVS